MNKMSINQRLDSFLTSESILSEDFRKAIGLKSTAQVSNWRLLRESVPPSHFVSIISAYQKLNARWLLTGDGEMLNKEVQEPQYPTKNTEFTLANEECQKCIFLKGRIEELSKTNVEIQTDFKKLADEAAVLRYLLSEKQKSTA